MRIAAPSCSARRDSREAWFSVPPVSVRTASTNDGTCSALSIALMSPNDS